LIEHFAKLVRARIECRPAKAPPGTPVRRGIGRRAREFLELAKPGDVFTQQLGAKEARLGREASYQFVGAAHRIPSYRVGIRSCARCSRKRRTHMPNEVKPPRV